MGMETIMIVAGILMIVAVAIAFCYMDMERRNDRAATGWLIVAFAMLGILIWASIRAEWSHELKHAAERRAVQEQVKDVRYF